MKIPSNVQFVKPILGFNIDGNGVLIGSYLLTAGHVVSNLEKYNTEGSTINRDDAIVLFNETTNENGLYYDYALFNSQSVSPLRLACSIPHEGEVLTSISLRKQIIEIPCDGVGIFATKVVETFEPVITKATVSQTIGNFIICDMEIPLAEGQSGSALIKGNEVFGILHGGVDGKLCVFQSSNSIRAHLMQQNKSINI